MLFLGCTQKYYKDDVNITEDEYLFYKNKCEKDYQEYLDRYNSGGIYAISQKRHHDEYMRECIEVINNISFEKKENSFINKSKESNEINIIKIENYRSKTSK